jgi:hypothetical protein
MKIPAPSWIAQPPLSLRSIASGQNGKSLVVVSRGNPSWILRALEKC